MTRFWSRENPEEEGSARVHREARENRGAAGNRPVGAGGPRRRRRAPDSNRHGIRSGRQPRAHRHAPAHTYDRRGVRVGTRRLPGMASALLGARFGEGALRGNPGPGACAGGAWILHPVRGGLPAGHGSRGWRHRGPPSSRRRRSPGVSDQGGSGPIPAGCPRKRRERAASSLPGPPRTRAAGPEPL